jgi:transposase InsO family protein
MGDETAVGIHERWAHLRFSVVGPLLAAPPARGQLRVELARLAEQQWRHPVTGKPVRFAVSTIERWYYGAVNATDPVGALRRKVRADRGRQPAVGYALAERVRRQHTEHPSWSYLLHYDNLAVLIREQPELGPLPSYSSLRRFMRAHGLSKQPSTTSLRDGQLRALERREGRETRSYEAEYVGGLWHLDFHDGSLKILTASGAWVRPHLLGILDDHSRLCCHAQWYLNETTECLVHGLVQALLKRGLPRALMSDNGAAMIATETVEGLQRLSILHQTTLPYAPHQNGKQENFWHRIESRLLAMLEGQPDLPLPLLNEATQAWVEMEYHHRLHSETGQTPLARFIDGPDVTRPCPELAKLRLAFTAAVSRKQRTSDGTVSIEGTRFEVPARLRHLHRLRIRYASWDLSHVWLVDEHTGVALDRLYPLDKVRNADGFRRPLTPPAVALTGAPQPAGIAPLLRELMSEYAATGLPPAYIPKDPGNDKDADQ